MPSCINMKEFDYARKLLRRHFPSLKFPKQTKMGKCEKCVSRMQYAKTHPNQVLMITSDSPTKIVLPSFTFQDQTKKMAKAGVPFRWTAYLNHQRIDKKLSLLYEPARWYDHDSNYGISFLDNIFRRELANGNPPPLFINSTDRGPEYNNKSYLAYLGLLVLKGVFGTCLSGRLPPGHRFVFFFAFFSSPWSIWSKGDPQPWEASWF